MTSNLNEKLLKPFITTLLLLSLFNESIAQKFTSIAEHAGIKHQFLVYEGMFGGGACVLDFNQDGLEDIFITGGMNDDALYLNKGNCNFENVYKISGLIESSKYVTQGAVGTDFNKDGWVDLFITTITVKDSVKKIPRAENLIFLNNGNSTFRNANADFKINKMMSFSTGACLGDFDRDGYTDVYVGNYFKSYDGSLTAINDETIVSSTQTTEGYLLRNVKGKYFNNLYPDYQLSHKGFGFGAVFTDFDNDSDLDLFIRHDFGYKAKPDLLLENMYPEGRFTDISVQANMDLKINAMGTAVGDVNSDGFLDYYVTNIRQNQFMMSQGLKKPFKESSKEMGLKRLSVSWGANFADFDNDADLDLFVSNGDLNPNNNPMADYYFRNNNGRFEDVAWRVGVNDYGIGRGSVVFDMDNDGDLDLLVVNQKPELEYPVESTTKLYRTDSVSGNWIKVALRGKFSDRFGIGARVEIFTEGQKQIREVDGGSSHISQSSTISHFGLGSKTLVDSIVVRWLGGNVQVLKSPTLNSLIVIEETDFIPSYAGGMKSSLWTIAIALFGLGVVTFLILKSRR